MAIDSADILKELEIPDVVDDKKDDILEDKKDEKKVEVKDGEEGNDDLVDENDETRLVTPPRAKDIVAKYPNIWKDFPGLKNEYFDAMKYKEIIPTIKDAQELVNRNKDYEKFESDLLTGNPESILASVKATDKAAFDKLVDNYLPALQKADQAAYYHVIGNVASSIISTIFDEAKRTNNEDLKAAAVLANQVIFGKSEPVPQSRMSKEVAKTEDTSVADERAEFLEERYNSVQSDFETRATNRITSTLDVNIDPKNSMSEYVKSKAIQDALTELDDQLAGDSGFKRLMDGLWTKALESNFNTDAMKKIDTAYISRAKTLLPGIIASVRSKAIKGSSLSKKEQIEEDDEPVKRTRATRPEQKKEDEPMRRKKTLDYLME